jgi:hypothetical protein
VVPDLEDVDARDEPAADQKSLDRTLRITGQQCREPAVADENDDRSIVDVALGKGACRIRLGRVEHLDRGGLVERDRLSGSGDGDGRPRARRIGHEAVVRRIRKWDARVQDGSHPESLEDFHQSGDVVLVRVAEEQDVDLAREEGKVCAQAAQGQLGIRPAVDQHRGSARRLEEDGVALADVEHGHMQQAVWPRPYRDRE